MAKKRAEPVFEGNLKSIRTETLQSIVAILFFVAAIFSILAPFNKAGVISSYLYSVCKNLFGIGYFLVPILLIMLGFSFLKSLEKNYDLSKMLGSLLFFLSGLGLVDIIPPHNGGILGHLLSTPLIKMFDVYASIIILLALIAIAILITFNIHFTREHLLFWRKIQERKDKQDQIRKTILAEKEIDDQDVEEMVQHGTGTAVKEAQALKDTREKERKLKIKESPEDAELKEFGAFPQSSYSNKEFVPPPLTLLERDKGKAEVGDIKANANIIKRTLQNFGINVEMDEISIGPSVTRYALKPAEGVKLSKIVALNNDLALALAAHPIRIEAPIPGKSLVGIEIPNTTKTTVGLGSLLSSEEFRESEKPLLVSLGKGISGKSYFSNLAKAPHMLIAGATGSGKSVTIHAIITSLLYRNSPENLRFIMIDPKRVELTLYNKIPHLLTPVITDARKAISALRWAAKEMDRRYDVLESHTVRDIESYHKNVLAPAVKLKNSTEKPPEAMPYIVIVIDELADIMQSYPRELEGAIVRLAQMSRAVGIHLMLSTQRPSVNVITGLIKANVPTRVALQVSSQIDSRTILDAAGAEKLLGAGDMLYLGAEMAKPQRLQSAYISESELKAVVKYLDETYKDEIIEKINLATLEQTKDAMFDSTFDEGGADEDDLYEDARQVVLEAGKASTSYIQRKLRVGYARAARLMDMLEERGVIGPADGAKPREVIDVGGQGSDDLSTGEATSVVDTQDEQDSPTQ